MAKTYEWTPDEIADGILTRHTWPGFQGTWCDKCQCKMNVSGMSYGHRCPMCDPEGKRYAIQMMHSMYLIPHEHPRFGPTLETIHAGRTLAGEIHESRRVYPIGTRVMAHDYHYGFGHTDYPVYTATVVEWDVENSWPGLWRKYRIAIDGGDQFKSAYESNLAPFRRFADGEAVIVKHDGGWVRAKIVGLVNKEKAHFLYRHHWYDVAIDGNIVPSSAKAKTIFAGKIKEKSMRPDGPNPNCRWCEGSGELVLFTSGKPCVDCWV